MTQTTPTRTSATADDVRWLTAEQQTHWRAYRDGTALLMDVLARELDEDAGLSLAEYEVLVRLSEAPGRTLRMSELAGELAHSRSRLTHTIRRMEDAGLVHTRREGRFKFHHVDLSPLRAITDRWPIEE